MSTYIVTWYPPGSNAPTSLKVDAATVTYGEDCLVMWATGDIVVLTVPRPLLPVVQLVAPVAA